MNKENYELKIILKYYERMCLIYSVLHTKTQSLKLLLFINRGKKKLSQILKFNNSFIIIKRYNNTLRTDMFVLDNIDITINELSDSIKKQYADFVCMNLKYIENFNQQIILH